MLGMVASFPLSYDFFYLQIGGGGGDKSSHRCKADGSYEL